MYVMCVPHTLYTYVVGTCTTAVDDIFEVFIFSRSLVLALVSGFSRTPRWGAGGHWHCSTDCPLVLNKVATFLMLAHPYIKQHY